LLIGFKHFPFITSEAQERGNTTNDRGRAPGARIRDKPEVINGAAADPTDPYRTSQIPIVITPPANIPELEDDSKTSRRFLEYFCLKLLM
jgi:hypothetical protein